MSVSGNGLKKIRQGRSVCFFKFIFLFLKNVSKYTVFTDFSPFSNIFFKILKQNFRVGVFCQVGSGYPKQTKRVILWNKILPKFDHGTSSTCLYHSVHWQMCYHWNIKAALGDLNLGQNSWGHINGCILFELTTCAAVSAVDRAT